MSRMNKTEWENARQTAFKAERVQKQLVNKSLACKIHQTENDSRPGMSKVQPSDIEFILKAANAPDVNLFLEIV